MLLLGCRCHAAATELRMNAALLQERWGSTTIQKKKKNPHQDTLAGTRFPYRTPD
jgi:hypothetical protein